MAPHKRLQVSTAGKGCFYLDEKLAFGRFRQDNVMELYCSGFSQHSREHRLNLHLSAEDLAGQCCQHKKGYIDHAEMREGPGKKDKRYGCMDAEKPVDRIFPRSVSEKTEDQVYHCC